MNDLTNLMLFLFHSGVDYQTWTNPELIDDESVELGAVISISIRGAVHMNFDAKGNLVGSSTDCAKSHKRKKMKKEEILTNIDVEYYDDFKEGGGWRWGSINPIDGLY